MYVGPNSTVCRWNNNFKFCCHKTVFTETNLVSSNNTIQYMSWLPYWKSETKEMVLRRLANTNLPLPNIASQTVERVTTYKLLGVHIDSTLSWSTHIEYIIKKATTRIYFLKQLKRAGLPNSHLLHFYITVIRPVLEYCAPVWHCINESPVWEPGGCSKASYPHYT